MAKLKKAEKEKANRDKKDVASKNKVSDSKTLPANE